MSDLKFAFRQLLKNPGFTTVIVLTLALGIGANTAMFSVINAVLLQPPPFSNPEQLVGVWQEYPKRGWVQESFSLPNFVDLQRAIDVLSTAGAYSLCAQTLRVPLLEGRHLTDADNESSQKVAVINSAMARQYWPGESAISKRIRPDALQTGDWLTLVGVVADMKNESLAKRPRAEAYYPYAQFPTRGLCAILRTSIPPLNLAESARREIWNVDGNLAIVRTQTMEETISHSAKGGVWLTFEGVKRAHKSIFDSKFRSNNLSPKRLSWSDQKAKKLANVNLPNC